VLRLIKWADHAGKHEAFQSNHLVNRAFRPLIIHYLPVPRLLKKQICICKCISLRSGVFSRLKPHSYESPYPRTFPSLAECLEIWSHLFYSIIIKKALPSPNASQVHYPLVTTSKLWIMTSRQMVSHRSVQSQELHRVGPLREPFSSPCENVPNKQLYVRSRGLSTLHISKISFLTRTPHQHRRQHRKSHKKRSPTIYIQPHQTRPLATTTAETCDLKPDPRSPSAVERWRKAISMATYSRQTRSPQKRWMRCCEG
jgi:hypothetical protein